MPDQMGLLGAHTMVDPGNSDKRFDQGHGLVASPEPQCEVVQDNLADDIDLEFQKSNLYLHNISIR